MSYSLDVLEYEHFIFYKGYKNDIEELKSIYEDLQGYVEIYNNTDIKDMDIDFFVDAYISFFDGAMYISYFAEIYFVY